MIFLGNSCKRVFGNKMAQNEFFVLTNRCIVFFILHEVNGWKLGKAFRLNCCFGFLEKKTTSKLAQN